MAIAPGETLWDDVEDLCSDKFLFREKVLADFVTRFNNAKNAAKGKKEGGGSPGDEGREKKEEVKELRVITDVGLIVGIEG